MHRVAKQIHSAVISSRHLLLIPHKNPDGDAVGSCAAFIAWLQTIGKPHTAFCATEVPTRFAFLPEASRIKNDAEAFCRAEIDTVIVFDSGDLRYAGVAKEIEKLSDRATIIAFDHHATNERYGHLNFVDDGASSTCELVHRFFDMCGVPVTTAMATALLTGLLTDTDNFTNAATSSTALTAGYRLLQQGAKAAVIKEAVFKDKTVPVLKLWGTVLARLERHAELPLAYTILTQSDLADCDVSATVGEGIANFMNVLGESRLSLLATELPDGSFKGSLRTTRNDTDVAAIAKALGGGGHKKAAGFTIPGPLGRALAAIFAAVKATVTT